MPPNAHCCNSGNLNDHLTVHLAKSFCPKISFEVQKANCANKALAIEKLMWWTTFNLEVMPARSFLPALEGHWCKNANLN